MKLFWSKLLFNFLDLVWLQLLLDFADRIAYNLKTMSEFVGHASSELQLNRMFSECAR